MSATIEAITLLLALLNPFLLVVYLVAPMKSLNRSQFNLVVARGGGIAFLVFCCFAVLGDAIFSSVVKAEFASFQIFGGIVFVLIGLQFVFNGPAAIEFLRGEPAHISGAIAMPVLIGPGTISASVIIGKRLDPAVACAAIFVAVFLSLAIVLALKAAHDYALPKKAGLVDRYIEIAGRITALYVGTIAIEMIMLGVGSWVSRF